MADITVVIPVRDDILIERCLRSINDARFEPLVVLNDPTAAVLRVVEGTGAPAVTLPAAGGPAACEEGVRRSPTRHVLLMDSDCVFKPDTLAIFHSAVGTAPIVRGWVTFAHYTRSEKVVAAVRTLHTNAPSFVFKVPLMVDRRIIAEIGGYLFDRRLAWTEDFEMSARIRAANISVRVLREAVVIHEPVPVGKDLRKALMYGSGHRDGVRMEIPGYGRMRFGGLRQYPSLAKQIGVGPAVHAFAFNCAAFTGYTFEGVKEWVKR